MNFFGRQGYPNTYSVQVITQDLYFSQSFLIGKVGDYRYPDLYELDFRLQETLRIGPVTVIPAVELFNVTNGNTVQSRDNGVGTYNGNAAGTPDDPKFAKNYYFNQIPQIQSPRIVRLGLQLNF